MSSIATEVLIILLLIVVNGVFAMSEIAVVSARKTRLRQLAEEQHRGAARALDLANSPDRFLSTVQIGITLIGIVAGVFGGATLAEELASLFSRSPAIAPFGEELAFGVVVLTITFFSLVWGELVPKRIALQNPERIASAIARPMHLLSIVASPLVHVLTRASDLTLRLLGVRPSRGSPVTEEEITVLLAEGAQAGVFEETEREIVERVFRFADQSVGSVMTPRTDIVYLDLNDSPEKNRSKILDETHNVFVICQGGLDHTLGVAKSKGILAQHLRGVDFDPGSIIERPLYVPESLRAMRLLERFRQSGIQIALVVDEYGSIAGLVTLDDILEALVGDIPWVGEPIQPNMIRREDGSWLVEGMTPYEEFKDKFEIRTLPGEEMGAFRTLGGFVVTYLGRIPAVAESFKWGGYRFEVVDMDGNRVDKVLVSADSSTGLPQ